ncbi:MAG TPA: hypothetical protein VMH90_01835, partial [Thermoplasmata archaeon]|nr:hypothetical protein [Thermoplasmata archaeon]
LITLWLNANHSGNVTAQLPTYLVFSPLNGTFTGPTNHQVVPLGNVTISYSYVGGYLSNASLSVFAAGKDAEPVFTTGIFVPAFGTNTRAGSVSWYATVAGPYRLVMDLGTPYTHQNFSEWINVTAFGTFTWDNTSKPITAIDGMSPATIGTALALVGAILGFLVGLFVAPAFRGAPTAATTPKTSRPWEEMGGGGSTSDMPECSVCHEHFSTPFALHAHQKSAHGIEE